jgi:phosphatidate cytidylyltransferase
MFIFRLFSSTVMISLFLTSILWKSMGAHIMFSFFAVLLGYFSVKEFQDMLEKAGKNSLKLFPPIISSAVLLSILMTRYCDKEYYIIIIILAIIVPWLVILSSINNKEVMEKVINSISALFLITFPLSFLAMIYMIGEKSEVYTGRNLLLYMVMVTKCGDIGAYCTGTLSNKILKGKNHKIVPRISPKKSWEGTIGGLVCSVFIAISLKNFLPEAYSNYLFVTASGILLFIGGFCGDLMESTMKRICGVKDSGASIPGMGGVLDFLDSLILNAPIFYLVITFLK